MKILLTTNPGIEDVVEGELKEILRKNNLDMPEDLSLSPFGLAGHVMFSYESLNKILPVMKNMRSIHHVLSYKHVFEFSKNDYLEEIKEEISNLDFNMKEGEKFRVTTKRHGNYHDFTSMDVQGEAGGKLDEIYPATVDLKNWDYNIRVDVYSDQCFIGLQHTRESLSKRHDKSFKVRASLKSNVAYALLKYAECENIDGAVLDPFCGSGTILLEAGNAFPHLDLYGSDVDARHIEGTYKNLENENLQNKVSLYNIDARELSTNLPENKFAAIITNPPYGVRLGKGIEMFHFYKIFLEESYKVLQDEGELVMLVVKQGVFEEALYRLKDRFSIEKVQFVETGGLFPHIYHLKKI